MPTTKIIDLLKELAKTTVTSATLSNISENISKGLVESKFTLQANNIIDKKISTKGL
jgi:hypothetical protein